MTYELVPTMTLAEIEKEVFIQYGVDVDVYELFWEDGISTYENYQVLWIDELLDTEEEVEWYGEDAVRQINMVLSVLMDFFHPMYDYILVYVQRHE